MQQILGMDALMEDERPGCSSTSTTDQDDIGCWNNAWSPVINWGSFCADDSDFQYGFNESMTCESNKKSSNDAEVNYDFNRKVGSTVYESSSMSEAMPPRSAEDARLRVEEESEDKGLRPVHLLIAAATALTGPHKSWDLARVIFVRLKELVAPAGATGGTNMERLANHFTDALHGLLEGPAGTAGGLTRSSGSHRNEQQQHQSCSFLAALQLLQDMSPYVKFGHFTANQAILESISGEHRVYIIDYDIMDGVKWASLMQAMVSRKSGGLPPLLRITAITRYGAGGSGTRRKSMVSMQETGRRLIDFAASIGLPFSFGQCRLDPDEKFWPCTIKVVVPSKSL